MLFSTQVNPESVSVAGIINLSPDSFYNGGRYSSEKEALQYAERLVYEGADLLDVGAESTRPGSRPVPVEEETRRLRPVVAKLCREFPVPVSVDTYKPSVAHAMLDLGADVINDITGLQGDPAMAAIISRYSAGVILMHMQGIPATMQENPGYQDVVGEIIDFLKKSLDIAEKAGIGADRIIVDPGIGFGKTLDHNLSILRQLERFAVLKFPLLLGASRKSFVGHLLDLPVEERLEGSLAAAAVAVQKGARFLRVHDVRATVRTVKMIQAILKSGKD